MAEYPNIEGRAFMPTIIQGGWKHTGMYPHNMHTILNVCPVFRDKLTEEERQRISQALPGLMPEARARGGALHEEDMVEFLTDEDSQHPVSDDAKLWCGASCGSQSQAGEESPHRARRREATQEGRRC